MKLFRKNNVLVTAGFNRNMWVVGLFPTRKEVGKAGHILSLYIYVLPTLHIAVHVGVPAKKRSYGNRKPRYSKRK